MLTDDMIQTLLTAKAKALATVGPHRVLMAVIKITPTAVFDVSADIERAGKPLSL
jgi:hypothetical protein